MIYVNAQCLGEAYAAALSRLVNEGGRHDDPEIIREDAAAIVISPDGRPKEMLKRRHDGELVDPFDYTAHFPHVTGELLEREMSYWNDQFNGGGKLDGIIAYLREQPLSKRAVVLFWEDHYRDLSRGAVCELAATFRLKDGQLEMHTHMRANNAAFLLYMDMRVLMGVQAIVAEALGVRAGDYVHFIDSLHVYEAEQEAAFHMLNLMGEPTSRAALN